MRGITSELRLFAAPEGRDLSARRSAVPVCDSCSFNPNSSRTVGPAGIVSLLTAAGLET